MPKDHGIGASHEAPRGRAVPDRQGPLHRRHQPAAARPMSHFLRSDVAHGRIDKLDTAAAEAMPGVLQGLHRRGLRGRSAACPAAGWSPTGTASRCRSRSTRSSPRARSATSATRSPRWSPRPSAQARDAAEAIVLDIEELPAVVDMKAALEPAAPLVHDEHRLEPLLRLGLRRGQQGRGRRGLSKARTTSRRSSWSTTG